MDTTQFWTQVVLPLVAGQNYVEHQRKGLYMRQFIYVYRDASVVRQESQVFPIATLELDGNPLDIVDDFLWQNQISERYGGSWEYHDSDQRCLDPRERAEWLTVALPLSSTMAALIRRHSRREHSCFSH
jgi:hypothetical protein